METATAGELNFSQQQVLTPRRGAGDYAPTDMLTPDTIDKIVAAFAPTLVRKLLSFPQTSKRSGSGQNRPISFPLLRDRLEHSILAMCGIPPALVAPTNDRHRHA